MNLFKEVQMSETLLDAGLLGRSVVYSSVCLFGGRELVNPFR